MSTLYAIFLAIMALVAIDDLRLNDRDNAASEGKD